MHLLVWLENFQQTPENIDSIVSSEIPDENSPIYECAITSYIHGPCGNINPHQPCMINHKCSKGFPKYFRKEIEVGEHSYALCWRRSPDYGGNTVTKYIAGTPIKIETPVPNYSLSAKPAAKKSKAEAFDDLFEEDDLPF